MATAIRGEAVTVKSERHAEHLMVLAVLGWKGASFSPTASERRKALECLDRRWMAARRHAVLVSLGRAS